MSLQRSPLPFALRLAALLPAALLLAALAPAAAAQSGLLDAKQIAAPAADVLSGRVRLPDPATTGRRSRSAWIPVVVEDGRATVSVPVEGGAPLAFALLPPANVDWSVRLRRPGSAEIPLARLAGEPGVQRSLGDAAPIAPGRFAERFDVERPAPGTWTFTIETGATGVHEGVLVVASESPWRLYSHVASLDLATDRTIAVRAWLYDARQSDAVDPPWPVDPPPTYEVTLHLDELSIPMLWSPEGWYEGAVRVPTPGPVALRVEARGRAADGSTFLRTTRHDVHVHAPTVELTGAVTPRVEADGRLRLELRARLLRATPKLQVAAEVWGRDADGEPRPACWLSGMVAPEPLGGDVVALPLWLDPRWLDHANVGAPLELRAVRVQDPYTHVPLARREVLALERLPVPIPEPGPHDRAVPPVAPTMLTGVAGVQLVPGPPAAATRQLAPRPFEPRALMLVHGYCSSGMPWPAGDFSAPLEVFFDPSQNRTHDEFAGLIAQFGSPLGSFGVVGHSQGGPAALHLYTYYWSGLDLAGGGRRIQSLGSPYQGTPLAALGGFSCGVNNDMTPEGAALWLAGIPTWARDDVWYWTTSNAGSWCEFLSDFLLTDPEDGVVEMFRAQLPGANSMGHTIGWCHTTGMAEPPQTTDVTRNVELDAAASR